MVRDGIVDEVYTVVHIQSIVPPRLLLLIWRVVEREAVGMPIGVLV